MKDIAAACVGIVLLATWPASAQNTIAMDQPVKVGNVETVCTGIGDDAQHDPRWSSYPVRVEFSNGGAQYVSGAHVELFSGEGTSLAALDCAGPWVLFKLAPGKYHVTARLTGGQGGGMASAIFSPPRKGQKRVVLGFHLEANK